MIDDEDHERFTHIVLEGYTPKDGEFVALENSVVDAMVNATPVTSAVRQGLGSWPRSRRSIRFVRRARRSPSRWDGRLPAH